MYKTQNVTLDDLKSVTIKNQREILRLLGSKLSLEAAWEEVKRVSNNFTKKVKEAILADSLLFELIKSKKQSKVKETHDQARIRIRERERLRKIKVLALELEMSNPKNK